MGVLRRGFEIGHRVLGVSLLACGFWQMYEGIQLYANKYTVSQGNENTVEIAYWVWIALMSAIIVFGGLLSKLLKSETGDNRNTFVKSADVERGGREIEIQEQ